MRYRKNVLLWNNKYTYDSWHKQHQTWGKMIDIALVHVILCEVHTGAPHEDQCCCSYLE